jgi:hypothetical protein
VSAVDSKDCEDNCVKNSSCTAYANAIGIGCMVWFGDLVDFQRLENSGNTLNIRLADSDLGKEKSHHLFLFPFIIFVSCDIPSLIYETHTLNTTLRCRYW